MSNKMGRPPIRNPKSDRIDVRINKEHSKILNEYCKEKNVSRADAIRNMIEKLSDG